MVAGGAGICCGGSPRLPQILHGTLIHDTTISIDAISELLVWLGKGIGSPVYRWNDEKTAIRYILELSVKIEDVGCYSTN